MVCRAALNGLRGWASLNVNHVCCCTSVLPLLSKIQRERIALCVTQILHTFFSFPIANRKPAIIGAIFMVVFLSVCAPVTTAKKRHQCALLRSL